MRKYIIINKILLILLMCLAPAIVFGANAGKVDILVGTAQVLRGSELRWSNLKLAAPVMSGDVIRTLKDSKVRLSLVDGSFLLLTEKTKMKVDAVKPKGRSFFRVFTGKLRAIVKKIINKGSTFAVRTPTAVAGVKGTDFILLVKKGSTEVITIEGIVEVSNVLKNIVGEVSLRENYYTMVTRTEPPTEPALLTSDEIEDIINTNGLSEEAMRKEAGEIKDDDAKEKEEPQIFRDDDESNIEQPSGTGFDTLGAEIGAGVDVEEPEIEDIEPPAHGQGITIQDPPPPPDYE